MLAVCQQGQQSINAAHPLAAHEAINALWRPSSGSVKHALHIAAHTLVIRSGERTRHAGQAVFTLDEKQHLEEVNQQSDHCPASNVSSGGVSVKVAVAVCVGVWLAVKVAVAV